MSLPTLFASLPMPSVMRPTAIVVRALNAVLSREPWAQSRLAQYAGRTLAITVGNLHLPLSFSYAGTVMLTESVEQADVQLTIPADRLRQFPAILSQSTPNPDALLALVHIQGDAGLANAVAQVVTQLRLDPEAEIARYTGDIFARRSLIALKQLVASTQRTAVHAEANLAEFLGEESGLLVSADYYYLWEDRLMQLEKRLQSLEQRTIRLKGKIDVTN